jgi:hypothetical protein
VVAKAEMELLAPYTNLLDPLAVLELQIQVIAAITSRSLVTEVGVRPLVASLIASAPVVAVETANLPAILTSTGSQARVHALAQM